MNISVSINRWQSPQAAPPSLGLAPDVLLKAGILRDPNKPEQALGRARTLAKHGRYKEARDLVCPHAHKATGEMRVAMTELLARCAMYGAGGDWESLLRTTLDAYEQAGDSLGAARTRRDLGDMLVGEGRFDEADRELRQAAATFRQFKDARRLGLVECLRARVRSHAGFVHRAHSRINHAIGILTQVGDARSLAIAKLERARTLAIKGDGPAAAKDLIAAERYLSSSGSALDRIRAKLTRAECLHVLGESRRASDGLKRVLADVVDLEEVSIRAWVHALLGESLAEISPSAARQYLMRARHLYESLKQTYHVARCDVALANVERRIGLNALGRLKSVPAKGLSRWPLLAAQYSMARAHLSAEKQPERARVALLKARGFAHDNGNRALMLQVDATLQATGLVADEELDRLTPAEAEPMVQAGSSPAPAGPRPEPYQISDVSDDVVIAPRPAPLRMIQAASTPRTGLSLKRPLATGVRRR